MFEHVSVQSFQLFQSNEKVAKQNLNKFSFLINQKIHRSFCYFFLWYLHVWKIIYKKEFFHFSSLIQHGWHQYDIRIQFWRDRVVFRRNQWEYTRNYIVFNAKNCWYVWFHLIKFKYLGDLPAEKLSKKQVEMLINAQKTWTMKCLFLVEKDENFYFIRYSAIFRDTESSKTGFIGCRHCKSIIQNSGGHGRYVFYFFR